MRPKKLATLFLAPLLAAGLVLAAEPVSSSGDAAAEIRAEPKVQPAVPEAKSAAFKARRADPEHVTHVSLEPRDPAAIASELEPPRKGAPLQIGIGRPIEALANEEATARQLDWQATTEGGQVAAIGVTAPDAAGTRVGVRIAALPADAIVRFYAGSGDAPYAFTGAEILENVARNLAAGESGSEARTFWSPVIESSSIVVEVELPAGTPASAVRIAIPTLSHLVTSAKDNFTVKAAASCELDAMCYQGTWSNEMNAVARIIFTSGGSSYLCSGTLVGDRDPNSFLPYFLTANHCVNTQISASSVQAYWFYRSTACNSGVRGAYQTTTGGASLLYNSANTDTSFMKFLSAPPAGTAFAGWVAANASVGSAVTGLHHPTGDLQKASFGSITGNYTCGSPSSGNFSCNGASAANGTFYATTWASGITEGGSSGSGLFLDNGHYLVGQLYGGSGSCTSPGNQDFYGRFDVAYNAALSQWLANTAASGNPTPTNDYSDLWWNANESGWGVSITQHSDNTVFAAWYLYDNSGNPFWIVMPGGAWTSSNTYTGDLYSATGPNPITSLFDPNSVARTRLGSGTLSFSSRNAGLLTYTVNGVAGAKSITRQPFGTVDVTPWGNYQDLWWNAAESGWGVSISQQYRTLFAVWYSYGSNGQPVWYVMPGGTWSGTDTYGGTVYRTASPGGSFLTGAFDPSLVTRTPVGTVSFRFSSASTATMSYTIDGIGGTKAITRQPF